MTRVSEKRFLVRQFLSPTICYVQNPRDHLRRRFVYHVSTNVSLLLLISNFYLFIFDFICRQIFYVSPL